MPTCDSAYQPLKFVGRMFWSFSPLMTSSNNKYTVFDFHHWNLEWTHSDQLVRFKPFRIVIGIFFIYRTVNCCWQVPWFEVWKTQQLARTYQYKHFENSFIFKNLNIWIFLLQYSETEISYIITCVSFLNTVQHILYFQAQLVLYSVYNILFILIMQ